MYNINPPSAPVERPHKPKLRKLQIEALNQFIHFGTSFSQTNSTSKNLYNQYKNEQKENYSPKSFDLFDHVVGLLDTLGKTFDFIEFKWYESEFISSKMLNQKDCDYDLRSAPGKYIDALGTLTTHNNMELIIVEASSGQLKENTIHSIEDTLKILKCGMSLLRKEAAHYNDASLSTFMKLKFYGVHVIKSQVTLSEISLDDETHWKCIELRSAKLPTAWSDRVGLVQYMELLATLYVCL
ncbi:hypothetical protein G6F46_011567 [Rhizopus delemar]|uniref:Uncharacterized protein n=2 Tax=Rhizopus TaxID=4842 RepID=A0A9P6YX42_9FUNG|nr:hypothetical protein G6F55_008251 [Rhizopus delemar]KAG1535215.1 hypothetical protein G6F51_011662 [Rhizopus arrhizus]KAG1489574.1 hypothetical protein G6F54_011338 [Rhizopus delemar]KAG1507174.1 hypothetical protein G6F53_009145 [Rhizopus delemar]KAG1515217.1 hypothetical protein G6F52_009737 [Rhizopus delemar]